MTKKFKEKMLYDFKASFCLTFCPSGKRKCRECVVNKLTIETMDTMKLKDLLKTGGK